MSTEQTPEVAYQPSDMGSDSHSAPSMESREITDGGGEGGGENRADNREFRRNRNRECYCRGRNKNCPKCQGTGQLLPNWRENLNAARTNRPQGEAPVGAPVGEAPRDQQPPQQQSRDNYAPRDNRGDGQQRDNYGRDNRQQRWQERRPDGGRNSGRNAGRNSGNQQANKGKTCPMCGEFVPNLRQHVLARHDD